MHSEVKRTLGQPTPRRAGVPRGVGWPALVMLVFVVFTCVNLLILERYRSVASTSGSNNKAATSQARHAEAKRSEGDTATEAQTNPPSEVFTVDPEAWHGWKRMDDIVSAMVPQTEWRPKSGPHAKKSLEGADALLRATGCDVMAVPFAPGHDGRCIQYLTNVSNWEELRPLAMRFDARTIKFQIKFREAALKSILKVPQRLFPNEAFSEVAAYHADRVLEVNRIPPTGWACIPIDMIKKATATYGSGVETEAEFLQDSGVKNYAEWIEKDLLDYAKRSDLLETSTEGGQQCIGASIQLHVADVHHLLDSPLKIPYKAHNSSWHRYFDLTTEPHQNPLGRFIGKPWAGTIVHIAELNAFDYVIGNGDRSPNKNNFIVGRCIREKEICDEDAFQFSASWIHVGPPTFVHLDQGMGFYETPRNNPLWNSIKTSNVTYCLFRAPLLNRLALLSSEGRTVHTEGSAGRGFDGRMADRLPRRVAAFVTKRGLRKCQRRVEDVLAQAHLCLKQPFARFVVAP